MSVAIYDLTVPTFTRQLEALINCLKKAQNFAEAKKIASDVLPNFRLAADMFPLSKQVQIATDHARGACARLAGIDAPVFEDNESSLPELIERVQKTLDFVRTIRPEQVNGSAERDIVLQYPGIKLEFKGLPYLLNFALPNFYFHATTAYAILRHVGVDLGKGDFLGNFR
jgi:hypothetical protein